MKKDSLASKIRLLLNIFFIFILNACNLPSGKATPEITSVVVENNCNIRINYIDHENDPNSVVFLKRKVGGASSEQIKKTATTKVEKKSPLAPIPMATPSGIEN